MDKKVICMETNDYIRDKLYDLFHIVSDLESTFPDRKFTLDGHLLGSIGEVLAEYYYGIKLSPNNSKTHDGEIDGKNVQIKITQGSSVDINDKPDYLIVFFLHKSDGCVYEVYNGPGDFLKDCKKTNNGWYSRQITALSKLDKNVIEEKRIKNIKHIDKWNNSIRN